MAVTPLVSVIIVNYNAGKLLLNCVESVFLSNNENYEVIIVDNCSSDNSHKECKKKFDRIKLIENSENLGYCEGNNVGIRNASGDYLLILNPDTVIESDLIEKFLETIKNYGEGLFQGKNVAIDNDNILRSTGNWINIFGFGYARDKGTKESKEFFNVEEIN